MDSLDWRKLSQMVSIAKNFPVTDIESKGISGENSKKRHNVRQIATAFRASDLLMWSFPGPMSVLVRNNAADGFGCRDADGFSVDDIL